MLNIAKMDEDMCIKIGVRDASTYAFNNTMPMIPVAYANRKTTSVTQ